VGAEGRRLHQKGVITLCVELGQLRTKAHFLVVPYLAAECILGCQFIDRHVRNILPREIRVNLADDSDESILQDSEPLQTSTPPRSEKQEAPSTKLRVSKLATLPTRSENLV
jgi:hypothetical protein